MSVSQAKIDSGREVYWQVQKTDGETNNGSDFPLLYGEEFRVRTIKPSMALENGVYVITGKVVLLIKMGDIDGLLMGNSYTKMVRCKN